MSGGADDDVDSDLGSEEPSGAEEGAASASGSADAPGASTGSMEEEKKAANLDVAASSSQPVKRTAEMAELGAEDEEEEEVRGADDPVSIVTGDHCFDVQFHPREPMVLASLVTGAVEFHRFDWEKGTSEKSRSLACHKESCRAVRFLPGPVADAGGVASHKLLTTSADKLVKVWDVEKGKRFWKGRLPAGGNALCPVTADSFLVGTDMGNITLHDMRQTSVVVRYDENEDFITGMELKNERTLAVSSGDGTLAIYDLRKAGTRGLIAMSDFQEDEFLSLAIVKDGTKVVCGSQTGVLCIFSWGDFGDQNDRIRGHPMSVDALLKVSETQLLSGSSDGKIRAVSVFSKETNSGVLGVVADHGSYPVECLSLSPCGEMFASASHGQPSVRVWPMEMTKKTFEKKEVKDDEEVDSDDSEAGKKKKKKRKKKKGGRALVDDNVRERQEKVRNASNFFGDL